MQGAKKVIFTACHSGKLKLTFTSPNIISTSPKNVLMSRLIWQYFCNLNSSKNFTCPLGNLITELTRPIAKSTSPRLLDTTFFARCLECSRSKVTQSSFLRPKSYQDFWESGPWSQNVSCNCLFLGLLMGTHQSSIGNFFFFLHVPSNNPRTLCSALSFLFLFVSKAASKVVVSLKIIKWCLPMYLIIVPCSNFDMLKGNNASHPLGALLCCLICNLLCVLWLTFE